MRKANGENDDVLLQCSRICELIEINAVLFKRAQVTHLLQLRTERLRALLKLLAPAALFVMGCVLSRHSTVELT